MWCCDERGERKESEGHFHLMRLLRDFWVLVEIHRSFTFKKKSSKDAYRDAQRRIHTDRLFSSTSSFKTCCLAFTILQEHQLKCCFCHYADGCLLHATQPSQGQVKEPWTHKRETLLIKSLCLTWRHYASPIGNSSPHILFSHFCLLSPSCSCFSSATCSGLVSVILLSLFGLIFSLQSKFIWILACRYKQS